ncbi:MAG TPA: hypothetical protein VJN89_08620 [Candidatus Acidoferrum sp.]|nr:hypothetical protein [Candidatus Acidoferrum sp.]
MRALEAKDFLVQQTAEQAALENVPLSDLEKRMMYFTETDECPEDAIALNEAFEAEYDTDEYEAKISKLMHHARARIKKENPELAHRWREAIKELSKGDHYILILCGEGFGHVQIPQTERPPYDSLKLLGTAMLVIVLGMSVIAGVMFLVDRYNIHWHWKFGPDTHRLAPAWIQHSLLLLLIGGYVYFLMRPWLRKRYPAASPGQLMKRFFLFLLNNRRQR